MTNKFIDVEPIEEFVDDDDISTFDSAAPLTHISD